MEVILRSALAKLSREIRENDFEVTCGSLPSVSGDADRLLQLFEYLLDHAMRHRGPNRMQIRISAEARERDWLLTVSDNGPGIEAELLERAFKPFERLQGKERPGPGFATCRVIVERHGGTIWMESQPGAGCTFSFTLPSE